MTKFHQDRDRALIQLEKDLAERRKREVKAVLDAQLSEQRLAQQRQTEERRKYENDLLAKCQADLEAERQKTLA